MSIEERGYLKRHFKADANLKFQIEAKIHKYAYLWRFLNTPKNPLILDIGSGLGFDLYALKNRGRVVGLDIIHEYLTGIKGFILVQASGEKLPFKTGLFDICVADSVLEHIPRDVGAVEEAWRVLKEGGYFIVHVPAHKFLWSPADIKAGHYRRYDRKEIRLLFERFKILYWNSRNFLLFIIQTLTQILHLYDLRNDEAKMAEASPFLLKILDLEQKIPLPFGTSYVLVAEKEENV